MTCDRSRCTSTAAGRSAWTDAWGRRTGHYAGREWRREAKPGPGNLSIPTDKIYELGNYESVATIRDTPDVTFDRESLDVSAEIESMLTGRDFAGLVDGTQLKMANCKPIDVASQFKPGRTAANPYDVVASIAVLYLVAETCPTGSACGGTPASRSRCGTI